MSPTELSPNLAIHLLKPEHAAAIQRLATETQDTEGGETEGKNLVGPFPHRDAYEFVRRSMAEHAAGESYVHVILDRSTPVGLCGLVRVEPLQSALLWIWIGPSFRGKGFAKFAVRNMLSLAFGPLRLQRVCANPLEGEPASYRMLEEFGFRRTSTETPAGATESACMRIMAYELTRPVHQETELAPFLRDLCADLRPIVESELAAGNEIAECSRGWPEKDSVVIAFRRPFRVPSGPLPANVEYREINDTHWWKAEYASRKPVHLLTCGFPG